MPFDFKKEYKEFYLPKKVPGIVSVPQTNYIAIQGQGAPNEANGTYKQSIPILYSIAYTLKMSYRTDYKINGFFDYVVPPLEGFWWQNNRNGCCWDYNNKDEYHWISVIRLPDFFSKENFDWAIENVEKKKKIDCSSAEFLTIDEGICVQIMHIGSFENEPDSIAIMDQFIEEKGYENDISDTRRHHEIYLSDVRKVVQGKWKTVIRHPIKKKKTGINISK